jgi:hypothetical protein
MIGAWLAAQIHSNIQGFVLRGKQVLKYSILHNINYGSFLWFKNESKYTAFSEYLNPVILLKNPIEFEINQNLHSIFLWI